MYTSYKPKLEVACFNIESALVAIKAKVNRIEFCDGLAVGGITPSKEQVRFLKQHTDIPIFVMIRPRGGNFCYSDEEIETMKAQLLMFKKLNVDGFVFGILDDNLKVNQLQNSELVDLAYPKPCTFHRAFDRVSNQFEALENVVTCGFSTILTSGCDKQAINGLENLKKLKELAKNRIQIMPGGGVRSNNLDELMSLQTDFYHTSGLLPNQDMADLNEIVNCMKILNE